MVLGAWQPPYSDSRALSGRLAAAPLAQFPKDLLTIEWFPTSFPFGQKFVKLTWSEHGALQSPHRPRIRPPHQRLQIALALLLHRFLDLSSHRLPISLALHRPEDAHGLGEFRVAHLREQKCQARLGR